MRRSGRAPRDSAPPRLAVTRPCREEAFSPAGPRQPVFGPHPAARSSEADRRLSGRAADAVDLPRQRGESGTVNALPRKPSQKHTLVSKSGDVLELGPGKLGIHPPCKGRERPGPCLGCQRPEPGEGRVLARSGRPVGAPCADDPFPVEGYPDVDARLSSLACPKARHQKAPDHPARPGRGSATVRGIRTRIPRQQRTTRTSTALWPSATVVNVIARATGVRDPAGIRTIARPPWTSIPMLCAVRAEGFLYWSFWFTPVLSAAPGR